MIAYELAEQTYNNSRESLEGYRMTTAEAQDFLTECRRGEDLEEGQESSLAGITAEDFAEAFNEIAAEFERLNA